MRDHTHSRTAWRVAMRRAEHQLVDRPIVFDDPLALAIVGAEEPGKLGREGAGERSLRAFIVVRSRFAEDELALAGLDTFAYRNPYARAGLRVFEVDHPQTQQ